MDDQPALSPAVDTLVSPSSSSPTTTTTAQLRNEKLLLSSVHKSPVPSSPRTVSFHFLPFPYSQESSYRLRQPFPTTETCEEETDEDTEEDIKVVSQNNETPPSQPTAEQTTQEKRQSTSSPDDLTMGHSLESSRPIMAASVTSKRESTRFSTYSQAPSLTPTSLTSDSAQAEIANIEEGLDKLENKKLTTQRYVLNQEKTENMSKLALGAKLERALGRRMGGQDAEFRVRKKVVVESEKVSEKQIVA